MSNMNVLDIVLLQPPSDCVDDDCVEPPLGLLYIAATLKSKGFDAVSLVDLSGNPLLEDFSEIISNIPRAKIYGINCFSTNYQYVKQIVSSIKFRDPNAYIVLGGPHPTAMPEFTLTDTNVDAVVVGEAEDMFCTLVEKFRDGEKFSGVIQGCGRNDIDSYPFPARELVDFSTYSRKLCGEPVVSMISSRGCAHHCIYCNSVIMGGGSKNVRYRSPDNVINEIKTLRDRFSNFRFNDDHFTGNLRLEELLEKLADLDIKFRIFARIQDLTQKICQLLKKAGCVHVSVGVESLNPENLAIIGKKNQIGHEKNIEYAKAAGLSVRASFMVGLPFDTEENINRYFEEAGKLNIDEFAISFNSVSWHACLEVS